MRLRFFPHCPKFIYLHGFLVAIAFRSKVGFLLLVWVLGSVPFVPWWWKPLCMHFMVVRTLLRPYTLASFRIQSLPSTPLRFLIGCSRQLYTYLGRILPSSYLFSGISRTVEIFGFMTYGCSRYGLRLPRQLSYMKTSWLLMMG
ncbi:hypothetical protein V6N12_035384 [Hibiscus sabdariffa]|uniref:Uncharacterized protein n=1 Tax=Hibiscus sabdariffa TaxID=183260 RepID=A0ABR2BSE5_9ROSI